MPDIAPNDQPAPQAAEPKRHSLTARILVALGFSAVGAKLSLLGTVADANALFKGDNLTVGQKFKSIFNGEFAAKATKKFEGLLAGKTSLTVKDQFHMIFSLMKWTTIVGIAGTVVGLVVGWVQGGKIEKWQDMFTHPWRSTKIIFGFEKPPEQESTKTMPTLSNDTGTTYADTNTNWSERVKKSETESALAAPAR